MRLRFWHKECPSEVVTGLIRLRRRPDLSVHDRRYVDDMLLYAAVGKERHKLTMDFVDRTEQQIEKMQKLFAGTAAE